ncbi:MAG TPA: YqgE/AlgH family protein [Tepidisphaeraceae bacterium]|nr:YqgE/AlgH family protein [Tepidisphaeraceae bacterium]
MQSLQGQLLLASRRLLDPNFARTVVLLVQHGEDGALGLVLNRPLDVTVKQACEDAVESPCVVDDVLYQGGPCQAPQLMALHTHPAAGEMEVLPGLFFCQRSDGLEQLLSKSDATAKFFVGYAGWSPGQLEKEMRSGSWLVMPATEELIFDASSLWSRLVTQVTLGGQIDPRLIPEDPSVN